MASIDASGSKHLRCSSASQHLSVLLRRAVTLGHLITQAVILALKTLGLFLQGLNIPLQGFVFLLQSLVPAGLLVSLKLLDLLFQTKDLQNHDVGTVKDQGEEESETAEVHVALRVKLAGLDFHALST